EVSATSAYHVLMRGPRNGTAQVASTRCGTACHVERSSLRIDSITLRSSLDEHSQSRCACCPVRTVNSAKGISSFPAHQVEAVALNGSHCAEAQRARGLSRSELDLHASAYEGCWKLRTGFSLG